MLLTAAASCLDNFSNLKSKFAVSVFLGPNPELSRLCSAPIVSGLVWSLRTCDNLDEAEDVAEAAAGERMEEAGAGSLRAALTSRPD